MSSFEIGSILWVKCGSHHWPAQSVAATSLDADVRESLAQETQQPEIILKFFNEDGYEFIYDLKRVFPYNGPRKTEFIQKGLTKCRSQSRQGATSGWFAKFPRDIVLCEELTEGDPQLLEKEPFVEPSPRPNYRALFGSPDPSPKAGRGRKRRAEPARSTPPAKKSGTTEHRVKILTQPTSPYHMDLVQPDGGQSPGGAGAAAAKYNCQSCGFSTTRLNVIVLHNKSHSESPVTPGRGASALRGTPKPPRSGSSRGTPSGRQATPSRRGRPAANRGGKKSGVPLTQSPDPPATLTRPKSSGRRGRRPMSAVPSPVNAPAVPSASPVKKGRPSRLSLKEKEHLAQETARKKEEREKILGDWADEEEEVEEKQKMRDIMEPFVDSSEEEEEAEGFMGDDNVHGNSYEGEEEADRKDREIEATQKPGPPLTPVSCPAETASLQVDPPSESIPTSPVVRPEPPALKEPVKEPQSDPAQDLARDLDKVLEETAVPELPSADIEGPIVKKRKTVSFGGAKEFANTKIALVQPESNLDDPMVIDDEFDEFVSSAEVPVGRPKAYPAKKILKRNEDPAQGETAHQEKAESPTSPLVSVPQSPAIPSPCQLEPEAIGSEIVKGAVPASTQVATEQLEYSPEGDHLSVTQAHIPSETVNATENGPHSTSETADELDNLAHESRGDSDPTDATPEGVIIRADEGTNGTHGPVQDNHLEPSKPKEEEEEEEEEEEAPVKSFNVCPLHPSISNPSQVEGLSAPEPSPDTNVSDVQLTSNGNGLEAMTEASEVVTATHFSDTALTSDHKSENESRLLAPKANFTQMPPVTLSNETNTTSTLQMVMTTSDSASESRPTSPPVALTETNEYPGTTVDQSNLDNVPLVESVVGNTGVVTMGGGHHSGVVTSGEDTYLILVDDGSGAVDSLNSQTLYIDPTQLENGKMVLMTNEGVPVSAQGVSVTTSTSAGNPQEILAALNPQPMPGPGTSVGTKLGMVETTPSSNAGPVMSPAEHQTSINPVGGVAVANNPSVMSEQQLHQQ